LTTEKSLNQLLEKELRLSEYRPLAIRRREDGGIEIDWSDGTKSEYSPQFLRDACPCATCREKRTVPADKNPLQVLQPSDVVEMAVKTMEPVGQYAYKVFFSDGHDSGIYTLEYLHELS
tara:strand:- start:892 stop:1248 length:357 start_codon:yes stop_codon:yes gene_type:complete